MLSWLKKLVPHRKDEILIYGFDPKNRKVTISEKQGTLIVSKPATGYTYETLTVEDANAKYQEQIKCSQNG